MQAWQASGWGHRPLRYPGPEANRWHGMSLSLTLMQTLTSIALQSLPELQPIMQQQLSQLNMPILRLLTFSYRLSLKLRVHGMLRPLSWPMKLADAQQLSRVIHSRPFTSFNVFLLPSSKQMQSLLRARSNLSESHISNRNCLIFSLRAQKIIITRGWALERVHTTSIHAGHSIAFNIFLHFLTLWPWPLTCWPNMKR